MRIKRTVKNVSKVLLVSLLVISWLITGYPAVSITGFVIFPPEIHEAQAATGGQMKLYFHKEPSDKNETYNVLSFTPPEPAADTASGVASTVLVNADPPTALCESSDNTGETFNKVSADASTTGHRCLASFISPPVGQTITIATGDTGAVAANIWIVDGHNTVVAATNIYLYKWDGTTLTRFKTFNSTTDPGVVITQLTFAATTPNAGVTINPTDRIVAIVSRNVTTLKSGYAASILFDSTARAASSITLKYTAITPNKPTLTGAKDDDFTLGAATTACSTSGVAFNTKWTCKNGTATNSTGSFNNGDTAGTTGDTSDWLWLNNQSTSATYTPSNFGTTPSNTWMYQALDAGYGNGTVRTAINSTMAYTIGALNPASPYSHTGLVLWTSDTNYLEVQVYSTAAKGAANTTYVALNNSGTLSGATSLNATVSLGVYNRVWVEFTNTDGSYQAQYSTDGTTWTNLGTAVAHAEFARVGLNAYDGVASLAASYAGAFEWFQHTFVAASTFTQNRYAWYYENTDLVNPTDYWPSGSLDLGENAAITTIPVGNDPPDTTQKLRLRVNFSVATANLAINTKYFKLQYRTGTDSDCSAGSWTDVYTGNAWDYAASGITDGADITKSLSDTTTGGGEEYVKSRPSQLNHVAANIGDIVEYDFHIVGTTATTAERYLFRVVESDIAGTGTTAFASYAGACPILHTEPGTGNLMRHGNVFTGSLEQGFYWAD